MTKLKLFVHQTRYKAYLPNRARPGLGAVSIGNITMLEYTNCLSRILGTLTRLEFLGETPNNSDSAKRH